MKRLILFLALSLGSCTSKSDFQLSKSQLEKMGYTEVDCTGINYPIKRGQTLYTKFKCKDQHGNKAEGYIYHHVFLEPTIEFSKN